MKVLVDQSCLSFCDPMDYSLCPWDSPGKNTGVGSHSFSRGSSRPRDQTQDSCIPGSFFTIWAMQSCSILWGLPNNPGLLRFYFLYLLLILSAFSVFFIILQSLCLFHTLSYPHLCSPQYNESLEIVGGVPWREEQRISWHLVWGWDMQIYSMIANLPALDPAPGMD